MSSKQRTRMRRDERRVCMVFSKRCKGTETGRRVFTSVLTPLLHFVSRPERRKPEMTPEERRELIATYEAGYDEVVKSLEGFPADRLTERPLPGKWSACEIVQHLADSEMSSAIRIRRLLAEDNPVILGYDQDDY